MSKINAVRLINVNYNNNAIKISDECLRLNGESTLFSLRNGGGKSVLVQMLTAPFVHKRYRDTKDRPFESYFTSAKPSFILVEWALDHNAGYVLTGMMVRRSQNMEDNQDSNLEMINLVSEYQYSCPCDIYNLPVVDKAKGELSLKSFVKCIQLFEKFKKDNNVKFNYYDMNNISQTRQYFEKLGEYQINYKEWETIIKKINLKESGLSDLFADCKDEKGLVEKWFLDAVENKLNRTSNRIKEFQNIMEKYSGQYKDNKSKIKRRDTIHLFEQEAVEIITAAKQYEKDEKEKEKKESMIALFSHNLNNANEEVSKRHEEVEQELQGIKKEIAHLEYEKLSRKIYELQEEQNYHISNRELYQIEKDTLEREQEDIERELHILNCAAKKEITDEYKSELEQLRQQIEVIHKKEDELKPERDYLGYQLKCHYKEKSDALEQEIAESQTLFHEQKVSLEKKKTDIEENEEKIRTLAIRQGELQSKVDSYEKEEDNFNHRYQVNLHRNILGAYDAGYLDIIQSDYEKELESTKSSRHDTKKKLEQSKESVKQSERNLEQYKIRQMELGYEKKELLVQKDIYEKETDDRKIIMKYLNIDEEHIYDTDMILKLSSRKLNETEELRRQLEKEEDELSKELKKLTGGKVLDIPKELEEQLANLDIPVIYGMEWLRKNGNSPQANREIVKKHPFLPYSLLMTKKDLEKLSSDASKLYTSFPVPIILREQLVKDNTSSVHDAIVTLEGVNFYVLFNDNLLDEQMLENLIQEKEYQIRSKKDFIAIRKKEYDEYLERHQIIKAQTLTKQLYEENKAAIQTTEDEAAKTETLILTTSEKLNQTKELVIAFEKDIADTDKKIAFTERRNDDFMLLCKAYDEYEANTSKLLKCKTESTECLTKKQLNQSEAARIENEIKTTEAQIDSLKLAKNELLSEAEKYQSFVKKVMPKQKSDGGQKTILSKLSADEMKARFAAISSKTSSELEELNERMQSVSKRYNKAGSDLEETSEKYKLKKSEWEHVIYNRKEENHQEQMLHEVQEKYDKVSYKWTQEDKQIAVLSQSLKDSVHTMKEECNTTEPLAKKDIPDHDFDECKNKLLHKSKLLNEESKILEKKRNSFNETITSLAEYSDFEIKEEYAHAEPEYDVHTMSATQLRNHKGILVRDYNKNISDLSDDKELMINAINRMLRMEAFEDEFYKKPLETLSELVLKDAGQVLLQLNTTIQSYDGLLEKLEVDISLVEKEKEKIIELIEEYVKEVHHNLDKIDDNSTITIRQKPVKMLKIQIPKWDDSEKMYHLKISDFIDDVTKKGIELFEKNENAQEFFGTQITTKNLYDSVVGIGSVQIQLYKVEEYREYPITWAQVAKNSGGEGFLSAFIILSSLLCYIRKDDADLFRNQNEGKVLLMDNPFAQTNASHLLKPLMDTARKTNTQLICLSGLGGESIYNRFNNIYVLNLVTASLKHGMQYLKADHTRGEEPELMVASQVEVVGQQELIF